MLEEQSRSDNISTRENLGNLLLCHRISLDGRESVRLRYVFSRRNSSMGEVLIKKVQKYDKQIFIFENVPISYIHENHSFHEIYVQPEKLFVHL